MFRSLHCQHIRSQNLLPPRLRHLRSHISIMFFCLLLAWTVGAAQGAIAPQETPPTLVLADSRGPMDGNTLVIGRDLRVGLTDGMPKQRYQFIVYDEGGDAIAHAIASTNGVGTIEPVEVWNRTGVDGCNKPTLNPGDLNFVNVAQASAALHGRTFKLAVVEPQTHQTILSIPIRLEEPSEATYYWSDAKGRAKCFFFADEPVYLSVFKGETEMWDEDSRVFMLAAPLDKGAWQEGAAFEEVRLQPDCDGGNESCTYSEGTIEPLPQLSTVKLQGVTPKEGGFLAIIRPATYGSKEQVRLECDRITESIMYVHSQPVDVDDSDDGWGCPACPP